MVCPGIVDCDFFGAGFHLSGGRKIRGDMYKERHMEYMHLEHMKWEHSVSSETVGQLLQCLLTMNIRKVARTFVSEVIYLMLGYAFRPSHASPSARLAATFNINRTLKVTTAQQSRNFVPPHAPLWSCQNTRGT